MIDPVVMQTVAMKEVGMPLAERFRYFPWMLSDLIFPFMMEYLVSAGQARKKERKRKRKKKKFKAIVRGLTPEQMAWYLIWETILNTLAELTYFADRSFYDAWWNSGKCPSKETVRRTEN